MFKKDIYKYKDEKGRVIVSPYKPNVEYEHMYRLIAQNDDYRLTNYSIFTQVIDIQEKDLDLWFEVHKDDLNTPISQNEEVINKIDALESVDNIHDDILNICMRATDEMFCMFGSFLPMTIGDTEKTSAMIDLYVIMVKRGLKSLDGVPTMYKEQVEEILNKEL